MRTAAKELGGEGSGEQEQVGAKRARDDQAASWRCGEVKDEVAMDSGTTSFPQNKVIVVGMLDTMLVRDRTARREAESGRPKMTEITHRALRSRSKRGRREELSIQLRSPYGGMFAMPLDLEPDVP